MNARYATPLLLAATVLVGCGTNNQPTASNGSGDAQDHAHPSEGPHGGDLIELGNEDYHAEMLHNEETKTITIYLLDSAAAESVAIDEAELTINVKGTGGGAQFTLAAAPEANDPPGQSSRFSSADATLFEDIESGTAAQLVVRIAGAQYRGDIEHDHEHEDENEHEHEH